MRAPTNSLVVPDWLPELVRDEAQLEYSQAVAHGESENVALIVKLVTDERMKKVWRTLSTRPKANADGVLARVIGLGWLIKNRHWSTVTRRELESKYKPRLHMIASELESIIEEVCPPWRHPFEAHELREATNFCRKLADEIETLGDNDTGDREAHIFALKLGKDFKARLGDYLPNQVAAIASVVFERQVNGERVRNWFRAGQHQRAWW